MATVAVNDTTLYVEDTGAVGDGPTVVFSHGLLWSTELFAPQIAALRSRFRCIAWDHRGQGRSAGDHRHHIGMELVWQDAVALIEHLAIAPVVFVGLSMGGFVGMRLAARRPDLVSKLVLIETSAESEPRENLARYRLLTAVSRAIGPRVVASRVAPIMFGKTFLADSARAAERERYLAAMTARRDIWKAVNGVIDRAPILPELARVRAPTLIMVGDEDVATVPAKSERIQAAIAGSELVRIPRAGHSSTVEQPTLVTAALERFLAQ
jgi:pimeloyl-ACP methyl ester carboxylesterase